MFFVGADGCKAGWFAVRLEEVDGWKVEAFPDLSSLWEKHGQASLILLDIPIGLRDSGAQERMCDLAARRLLGRRAPSVFPAPCQAALRAKTYEEASKINLRKTERRLSIQTWNILPKIREVNDLLSREPPARFKIREAHPEVCFRALAGHPMRHPKKTRKGFDERRGVLESAHLPAREIIHFASSRYPRSIAARDDLLDALVLAVTALEGAKGLVSIPEAPEFDSAGQRMEIAFRPRST